jgi:hypothetical protein
MNQIHRVDPIVTLFRDDPDLRYGYKHRAEAGLTFHGDVTCDHYRKGELIHTQTGPNTFTTEGMARILNIIFGVETKSSSPILYCSIFKTNTSPGLSDTGAVCLGAAGTYGSCQDAIYAATKPSYTIVPTATAVCTNAAAAASFTMAGGVSETIYGAFLNTIQSKTADNSPYLFCAKKFGTARAVIAADVLAVTYVITASTSA